MDKYTSVPTKSESQLEAAVALGPVAVAIEADQAGFQSYKSGVFDGGAAGCGTKLDHGVLVVGYSPDYWIVKNSWGPSWGEEGAVPVSCAYCLALHRNPETHVLWISGAMQVISG